MDNQMSQSIVSEFIKFIIDKPIIVFKASEIDSVITIEVKNNNTSGIKLDMEVFDDNGVVQSVIKVNIPASRSYKKHNVLCLANGYITVKTNVPGLYVRAYIPSISATPGQVSLLPGESKTINVNTLLSTPEIVTGSVAVSGVTITPSSLPIVAGTPAVFTLTRDATGIGNGIALFKFGTSGLSTTIDVSYVDTDDTNNNDPAFDIDIARIYAESRDFLEIH